MVRQLDAGAAERLSQFSQPHSKLFDLCCLVQAAFPQAHFADFSKPDCVRPDSTFRWESHLPIGTAISL